MVDFFPLSSQSGIFLSKPNTKIQNMKKKKENVKFKYIENVKVINYCESRKQITIITTYITKLLTSSWLYKKKFKTPVEKYAKDTDNYRKRNGP